MAPAFATASSHWPRLSQRRLLPGNAPGITFLPRLALQILDRGLRGVKEVSLTLRLVVVAGSLVM